MNKNDTYNLLNKFRLSKYELSKYVILVNLNKMTLKIAIDFTTLSTENENSNFHNSNDNH